MVMTVDLTYGLFNSRMFRSFNLNTSLWGKFKKERKGPKFYELLAVFPMHGMFSFN